MRREYLLEMGEAELDAYARTLGVDASGERGAAAKVALIESRRERVATIEVLGMTVEVPVKRMHDRRVTDRLDGRARTNEEADALLADLIGEGQMAALRERCTDEDGTVDLDAYGLAFATIVYSDELKNF